MNSEQILTLPLPDRYRLIAVSDIHGSLDVFLELLETANYRPGRDFLVLPGDFFGKGPKDVETLVYICNFVKTIPRVYALAGNVDLWMRETILSSDTEEIIKYIQDFPKNLFSDAAEELGISAITAETYPAIRGALLAKCAGELDWLANLPLAIDTPEILFTHEGIESLPRWQDSDPSRMHRQNFYLARHHAGKWVAAGHLPTGNQDDAGYGYGVLVCPQRQTIAIDGGNMVLVGGQVNALIAEKAGADAELVFSSRWADGFPKRVMDRDAPGDFSGFVRVTYLTRLLEILERGEDFSLVRTRHSGETGLAKNEYIFEGGEGSFTRFHLSAFPSVRAGEQVSVIDGSCPRWLLIRNAAGELGWVTRE